MKNSKLSKKVWISVLSIILFALSYIVLIALAVGLTIVCCWFGIKIIALKPSFYTLLIGIAFFILGLLVLYFLIKFSFQRNKSDNILRLQISEKEYPAIFQTVRELSKKINTSFPKKIYLTPDVNASVFYNSNFWSMILPTRKNLQIGLGLANSLTDEELKAIIAHELGHFSQKSMTVGSYVYHVNQVIYNLLYNNSYHRTLEGWANVHAVFAISARISFSIIQGIQWILSKLYYVVNVSYLSLSREMEFHADAIAANATNPKSLIDSLLKLEYSNIVYNGILDFYNEKITFNEKTENIFLSHLYAMQVHAKQYKFPLVNGLPVINPQEIFRLNKSRVNIKNQWASHPSTPERIERLEEMGIPAQISERTAWNYFEDPEKAQKNVTAFLFSQVRFESDSPKNLSQEIFQSDYLKDIERRELNDLYKGYYDSKNTKRFDLKTASDETSKYAHLSIDDIFNEENKNLLYQHEGLVSDIDLLQHIDSGKINVRSFDFDGKRYKESETYEIKKQLIKEKEHIEQLINENDIKAYSFFYLKTRTFEEKFTLQNLYNNYFDAIEVYSENIEVNNSIIQVIEFIQGEASISEVNRQMRELKEKEAIMKNKLKELIQNSELIVLIAPYEKEQLDNYMSQDWIYFDGSHYNDPGLKLLFKALKIFHYLSDNMFLISKKKMLDFQVMLQ